MPIDLNGRTDPWERGQQRAASLKMGNVFQSLDIFKSVLFLPQYWIYKIFVTSKVSVRPLAS